MRAFLLAAGLGTRLRPITNSIPKCLVPINGLPILYYWLKLFEFYNVTDILINTHYRKESVEHFCYNYRGHINIRQYNEIVLLGSLGTILNNLDFIKNESAFLVCYADNLTNINLAKMINFHINNNSDFTMGLFYTSNPLECGIVEMDENNNIISFVEKPSITNSNLANAGIYIVSTNINYKSNKNKSKLLDISHHLIPLLLKSKKMKGYLFDEFIMDIGTLERYTKANELLLNDKSLFKGII